MTTDLVSDNLDRAETSVNPLCRVCVPRSFLLVSGVGDATHPLNAFDRALQSAGVGDLNLVKVTSILPPGVKPGVRAELPGGAVVYAAIGSKVSTRKSEL
ncbi:MAG TPA: hypothetical protein ENL08_05730, partial [Bacteroidetes bacterium]|nr:hypothetical protein [Bacteroidota bacterium]